MTSLAATLPPFSYVLAGGARALVMSDPVGPFLIQGRHPGHARPLHVRLDDSRRLTTLLSRAKLGSAAKRAEFDALLGVYFDQYSERLRYGGAGEAVRAEKFEDLLRAVTKQEQADVIQSMLPPSYLEPWQTTLDLCGTSPVPATANYPAMGLRLAAHLLTHPTHRARHCTVVDTGLRQADSGGGYDTHSEDPITQTRNLDNFLLHLLDFINEPGENHPTKLDLDETMIILNTEFGRTPAPQGGPTARGRNHWSHGFVQVYIGGPIRAGQAGIYGHIDDEGYATVFASPAEHRIAALLALGVYPFEADSYSSSDVQGAPEEGRPRAA